MPQKTGTIEKTITVKTIDIICVDCGAIRTIAKGEAFQVKRCEACQAIHKKILRKEYRKNRVAGLKERITHLEAVLTANHVAIPA